MKLCNRFFCTMLLFVLLFAGCGSKTEPQGIFYPALSHSFLMETFSPALMVTGCYSSDAFKLYYNGEVYTLSHSYQEFRKDDLPLETLSGNELCTVYGNERIHWADSKESLAACTHTGTLYQVPGYKEDFRVCLYFEEAARPDLNRGPIYHLYVFDRTNNITLRTGKDYYTDLYQIPADSAPDNLDKNDSAVAAFMDALLEAEFIDPEEELLPEFDFQENTTYYLSFTDSLGLTNSIAVYEDGYVVDKEDYNFILKLEPALCQAMIDKFHQPEWPGEYKYVTYSYDKDRDIRTEYKYELNVTENDTNLLFDLCVTHTETPLNQSGILIDTMVIVGPADTFSVSKEDSAGQHLLSFVSGKLSDTRPDLVTYIELKKGLQDDMILLRYASSEEELEEKDFITLKKQ